MRTNAASNLNRGVGRHFMFAFGNIIGVYVHVPGVHINVYIAVICGASNIKIKDIIMKKRKPRTNNNKINQLLKTVHGNVCWLWDDGHPECLLPWSYVGEKREQGCNGNPFKCRKLFYRYLNAVKKPSPRVIAAFNARDERKLNDYWKKYADDEN